LIGLGWTAAIWSVSALVLLLLSGRFSRLKTYLNRENLALMIALLGTFAITPGLTEAEQVLRDPVVIERVIRGGLAALALAIALPMLIARWRKARGPGYRTIAAIVVYLGISLISTLFSAAPIVTGAKIFEMTAGLSAVLAVAYGPEPARRLRETFSVVIGSQIVLLLVGVVGFFVAPSTFAFLESRPGFVSTATLSPPYLYSNAVSATSALLAVYALGKLFEVGRGRRLWSGVLLLSLVGVILASGRQGVAMALVGLGVVLFVRRKRLFVFLLAPGAILVFLAYQDVIIQSLSRDRPSNWMTLSGRLPWWEAAVRAWTAHPWTGWGYATGGRFVALESIGGGDVSSVHSGFIEVLVGVGIIGLIPFLYALGRVLGWSFRNLRIPTETALAALIFPLILRTAVSPGFGGWLNIEFVLFALLAAITDRYWIDRRHPPPVVEPDVLTTGQSRRLSSPSI
jgi:O-antigen ligase